MNGNNRGFSPIALIIGLVVLVGLVLGGVYLFSDVWRTKMGTAYEGFAKWTPENIAKDPLNYLKFCEEQTNQAAEKLKASKIAIEMKKGTVKDGLEKAKTTIATGKKALGELRIAYLDANATKSFPVTWENATLDQESCERQILQLAGQIKAKEEVAATYESVGKQLDVQANKVAEAQGEATNQLTKIKANQEVLKVQAITDDLKNQLVEMKGALGSVVAVSTTDTGGTISLEDLAARKETAVDRSKLGEILNEK
jgi:hypothetical protein